MIKFILSFVLFCSLLLNSQTFEWAHSKPVNISTNPFYLRNTVSADAEGNPVYSHLLNNKYIEVQTYYGDVELVKRNPAGNIIWTKTVLGKIDILRILIDDQNNIICAGTFKDSLIVDENNFLFSTSSSFQSFILRLDAKGNTQWLKHLNPHFQNFYNITSATLGNDECIWLSADDFGNSTIYKFDESGNLLTTIEQTGVRGIGDISVDNTGSIWVTGVTNGFITQSFNGLDTIPPFSYNEYVVKYSPSGEALWIVFIEDITFQSFRIVTDENGYAYLAGNLFTSTWFGNIHANAPSWVFSYFLTRIDPDGNFVWLHQTPFGSPAGDAGLDGVDYLHYSKSGYVYLTGFMRNHLNFGNGVVINTYGSYDVFVLKYNSAGELKWAVNAGSISFDNGNAVTSDQYGNCYITGFVSANALFGNINLTGGNLNQFIAKITDEDVVPVELSSFTADVTGNSVTLNWSTSSELNNSGFEVERFSGSWEKIGFVEGNGTTTEFLSYSFVDDLTINHPLTSNLSYRLKQVDFDGSYEYSNVIEVELTSPSTFSLEQNYPNPFNPSTKIKYTIPVVGTSSIMLVQLKVYDVLGNEVAVLVNEEKPRGVYEIEFNASELSSGVYYYKLTTDFFSNVKKMIILK